jgi:hypothetical protein
VQTLGIVNAARSLSNLATHPYFRLSAPSIVRHWIRLSGEFIAVSRVLELATLSVAIQFTKVRSPTNSMALNNPISSPDLTTVKAISTISIALTEII